MFIVFHNYFRVIKCLGRKVIASAIAFLLFLILGFSSKDAVAQQYVYNENKNGFPSVNIEKQREATSSFAIPIEQFNGYAGTYGELRGNHFHCGLDMRTTGVVGKKIYAAEEGYVSRISVSAWGFGNMIMIAHPSGYKTIYGHLLKFAPKYQKVVREKQYAQKSWNQEIDFAPDEFPVKRGELIAYSGNSGSSGGPHLHFEVRDEDGIPVNLQLTGTYNIKDSAEPVIRDVKFIGCIPVGEAYFKFPLQMPSSQTKYVIKKVTKTKSKGKKYTVNQKVAVKSDPSEEVIEVPMGFYVAVDAYDYKDANSGKLAIYKYEVFIDDEIFFCFEEGNIPYDKGRYIGSLLDHRLRLETGRYYVKTQTDPANLLGDRIFARRSGVCTLRDTLEHSVIVKVTDVCGNVKSKSFKVRLNLEKYANSTPSEPDGTLMKWNQKNVYNGGDFNLTIPEGALYSNFYFTSSQSSKESGTCPTVWKIGDRNIPLHKSPILELKYPLPDSLASKAVIARINEKGGLSSSGGKYNRITQSIIGNISSFGNYTIAADLTPPKITFKFSEKAKITAESIKIVIGDNLSGVESFEVNIDGHWVVAEYDGKTSTLLVPLADARIARGKRHSLSVEVTDGVGNISKESRNFIW